MKDEESTNMSADEIEEITEEIANELTDELIEEIAEDVAQSSPDVDEKTLVATIKKINPKKLSKKMKSYNKKAEEVIKDEDSFERFVQRLENKLKLVPKIGKYMSDIACLVSLVRSYVKGEYKDIPIGTIIAIVGALLYIISPIDVILDIIPLIGYIDDIIVLCLVLKFIHHDVEEYKKWRVENGKQIIEPLEIEDDNDLIKKVLG